MKFLSILTLLVCLTLSGCGNFSPRMQDKLNNQNGKIEEMDRIQQGLKLELLKLQNRNEITDSQLDRIQQGIANLQSNYTNSGVEVFSGPGGLVAAVVGVLGICVTTVMVFYYRGEARKNEKAANLLAEKIVRLNNSGVEDDVFQAAMYTDCEEKVLELISKHQRRYLTAQARAAMASEPHEHTET